MAANLLLVDDDLGAIQLMGQLLLVRVGSQLRSERMADELRFDAATDAPTGVANRRWFDDSLQREWLRVRRTQAPTGSQVVASHRSGA